MRAAATAPPLAAWGLSAVIVLLVLAGLGSLHWLGLAPGPATPVHELKLSRLQASAGREPRIVVIGSSKILWAVDFDQRFERRLHASNPRASFVRITLSSPVASDLDPVLAALLDAPPDLLVLEADMFIVDRGERRGWHGAWEQLRRNLFALRRLLPSAPGAPSRQNWGEEVRPGPATCRERMSEAKLAMYAAQARRWRLQEPMRLQQDLKGVLALARAGTRVALVEVPRSPRVASLVPDEVRAGARQQVEELAARHGWLHAVPPQPPAEHYCDPMHMHEEGRETYSRWLAGAIQAWLVTGDG